MAEETHYSLSEKTEGNRVVGYRIFDPEGKLVVEVKGPDRYQEVEAVLRHLNWLWAKYRKAKRMR